MSAPHDERRDSNVTEEMLHAFADGQLDNAHRGAVEAFLAANPDKAAEVALWQRQNAALSTLFGPIAVEPVPARLSPREIAARQAARRPAWARMAAAAVLLISIGAGTGWYLRTATTSQEEISDRLIDGAIAAHALYVRESRHAVEVGAADKGHLVTWLSNRLGRAIEAPDLSAQGFTLVGGRLLPPLADTGKGPGAQLMYQNQTSDRLTVYITASSKDFGKASETYDEQGLEAYYWANDQITCTVVGDLPQTQMQTVAKGVFQQLSWRPDPPGRS
ncbi:MAG TPA: anti-sigma factor [Devosiaceae bacterium]|jgi:anti-sigma factor RsiW|nr:anti-sigma factor [Devosiaceae bacterium]